MTNSLKNADDGRMKEKERGVFFVSGIDGRPIIRIFLFFIFMFMGLEGASYADNTKSPESLLRFPQVQKALESGRVSSEDLRKGAEAVEEGKIDDRLLEKYREKAMQGTLTPSEIEAGRKLMEARQKADPVRREDRVYLYGAVKSPGEYAYKAKMKVTDILPGPQSLQKNADPSYALIKRRDIGILPDESPGETDEKKISSLKKTSPFFMITETGEEVELIPLDLGRIFFSGDKSRDLELRPRDEIHVFEAKEIAEVEEEKTVQDDFFEKRRPEDLQRDLKKLEIFGHNLFSDAAPAFPPMKSIPVSENYMVGPGDEIQVVLWGRMEKTYQVEVDNEGLIHMPKIGPVHVAGLLFGELKTLIREKAEAMTGVQVSVSMGRLKSIQVFALGEVRRPGLFTVSSLSSVSGVLMACGGPTDLGSLRNIQLKRNGSLIETVDLYDFLLKGDTSGDTTLMNGDVVFVPQVGPMISILGDVRRPAVYELKGDLRLSYALSLGGGLKAGASGHRILIERAHENREKIVLDTSLSQLKKQEKIMLRDGDVIRLFPVDPSPVNAVLLFGNVLRPGKYAYKKGMRIRDILSDVNSLKPDTYYEYALIKRYRYESMNATLIPFDPGALLVSGDDSQNHRLLPRDEIYIFDNETFSEKPFAFVDGAVRKPGRYLIDDMTVRDLLLKAGDLASDAFLKRGELVRFDKQRNRHTLYFNVGKAMAGDPAHNLSVEKEDRIIIHSAKDHVIEAYAEIRGEVKKSGRYALSKGMRLSDLVFKAGGSTRDTYMDKGHLYRIHHRTRNTTIHSFDLEKALAGDPDHNLRLSDMDEVILHNIWEYKDKYTVQIKGLVRNPGEYPYAGNMTVRDLIMVSGNVRDAAFMDEAELVRFSIVDGRKVETSIIQFNIRMAQDGHEDHNLLLHPMDVVTIKEIPEWWAKKRSVTINGELHFPGTYQIRKGERLSDVIRRAGGFTEHAYLTGAVFTRESVRTIQQSRIDEMMQKLEVDIARLSSESAQTSLSNEDIAAQAQFMASQRALLEKLKGTRATGRVIVDILPLAQLEEKGTDLILENGDSLEIPRRPNTVNVIGAVYNPTAVIHDEQKMELSYYLDLTGGPTENADEDLIYVIRANGTVVSSESNRSWWRSFDDTRLDPGDTVIVPERVVVTSYMRDLKDITQILYQIAITAGVTVTQIF